MKITYDKNKRRILEIEIEDNIVVDDKLADRLILQESKKQPIDCIRFPEISTIYGYRVEYQQAECLKALADVLKKDNDKLYVLLEDSYKQRTKFLEEHVSLLKEYIDFIKKTAELKK